MTTTGSSFPAGEFARSTGACSPACKVREELHRAIRRVLICGGRPDPEPVGGWDDWCDTAERLLDSAAPCGPTALPEGFSDQELVEAFMPRFGGFLLRGVSDGDVAVAARLFLTALQDAAERRTAPTERVS